jgi:pimeloyl-ACP methyl ester carboxylesterase
MPQLRRPGTFISYREDGAGPPLLLTHGFAATSAMFDLNLPVLTRGNRVIRWDLRGHGASGAPQDQACYTAAASVADMAALLDHLQLGQAVLGGHSLGGYLSLAFALAHPDRVSGLLLIGTGPGFRNELARQAWNRSARQSASNLEQRGLRALRPAAEQDPPAHRSAAGLARAARGILTQHDATVIDGLPSITVPVLIIAGAADTRFLAPAEYMAAKIPGARLAVIPDAGHAPNIAQPAEFAKHARPFLDQCR